MILDALVTLGSLIIPPAFDFIKKKFIKGDDTPEATLNTLATTKPEVIPEYIKANSMLLDAQVKFFNRDVIGMPHQWVVDLRAAIRPIVVIIALGIILVDLLILKITLDEGIRLFFESVICSWFGSRISK